MFFKNQRIGKYQILDTIGTGGFGSVYLAKDVLIDKKVAIKVPHKQGENVEKLLLEPRMLAALNHANIVSVLTAEQINNVFFIVMEYVDGTSLERHLRNKGPLHLELGLRWFIDIAEALAYAHRKQIIHRDIRPANILISTEGNLKVGDLGTSRYLMDDHASTRIGSPPYMSPEHFQGKATYQSDLYSLGVLMYESLTGKLPYYDKNPQKLAQLIYDGAATPVHQINDQVPEDMSHVVQRAMDKRLAHRYANAEALLTDLKKLRLAEEIFHSQDLSHILEDNRRSDRPERPDSPSDKRIDKRPVFFPKDLPTREISRLFCWNCSRPIQKRTRNCPHCNVALK